MSRAASTTTATEPTAATVRSRPTSAEAKPARPYDPERARRQLYWFRRLIELGAEP